MQDFFFHNKKTYYAILNTHIGVVKLYSFGLHSRHEKLNIQFTADMNDRYDLLRCTLSDGQTFPGGDAALQTLSLVEVNSKWVELKVSERCQTSES